jgi:bifunctional DNA-binding transcriptional regulator/antitoxin component of YhaV-PrlF toxin-antitoxin module
MYSSQTISQIKELRKNGSTLTEIVEKIGLSKSRIFDYIKDIPQSKYLIEKIKKNKLENLKILADKRRGKSVKNYSFNKPKEWSPELVNLVAHFLFDGRISHSSCTYFNRSEALICSIAEKMETIIGVSDYKRYLTAENVKRIAYHNVEIAAFMKEMANKLFPYIIFAPVKYKISFLRAFFDDEGSVKFKEKTRIVRGYQHSSEILKIVKKLLADLDIQSSIDEKYFEITISRKENLIKFQKLINFTSGLRVNGKRTNSIWKKDLEKREILRMAIDSYLPA